MNWLRVLAVFLFIGPSQRIFAQETSAEQKLNSEIEKQEAAVLQIEENSEAKAILDNKVKLDRAERLKPAAEGETASQDLTAKDKEEERISVEAAKAHYNLGELFFKSGQYQKAADEFKRTVELMPDEPSAYYNLAVIYDDYLEDGNRLAIKYYRKYLQLVPDSADAPSVKEKLLQAETEERLRIGGVLDREPPEDQSHH